MKIKNKLNQSIPSTGVASSPKEEGEVETKDPKFDSSVAVMTSCNLKSNQIYFIN